MAFVEKNYGFQHRKILKKKSDIKFSTCFSTICGKKEFSLFFQLTVPIFSHEFIADAVDFVFE